MTKIYLVRHAEAEGNIYRRCHGHYNGLLTGNGYRQLKQLEERFSDIALSAVYTSDLFRTRRTAEALCKNSEISPMPRRELREISMGDWEDIPWGDAKRDFPEEHAVWSNDFKNARIPGGESVEESARRLYAAISDIAGAHDGETVGVVSHGAVIRGFLSLAQFGGLERIDEIAWSDNTSVSLLEYDSGEFNVIYHSDNSHGALE